VSAWYHPDAERRGLEPVIRSGLIEKQDRQDE